MKPSLAAWPLLAAALWARAAEPIPTELFPPDTHVVVSLSLRSLLDSPLLQATGSDRASLNKGIAAVLPLAGIDPLKDLDTIVLAVSGEGKNPAALAVLRGRFAARQARGATLYHGVSLFPDPKDAKNSFAILDGATAIAGPTAALEAAIDRRRGAPVLEPALAGRLAEFAGHYDFWCVGRIPEGLAGANSTMQSLQSIGAFEFGATLHDGLRIRGEIRVRTPQDAARLETPFQPFAAMMNGSSSSGGTRFDLHAENGRVDMDLFVPEAELRKALATQKDGLATLLQGGIGAGMGWPGAARPATAFPSAPARSPASHPPASPGKTVTNGQGETVVITLPTGRN